MLPAHILVAETDATVRSWIRQQLPECHLVEAESGSAALSMLQSQPIDIVITSNRLPDMTGLELCRQIRCESSALQLPLLLLTNETKDDTVARAFDVGFLGVLHEPPSPMELQNNIEVALRFKAVQQETQQLAHRLLQIADRDPLTNLYNRRYLQTQGVKEISRAQRTHEQLSILMIDIDHFKQINDTHGHLTGDEVLIALTRLLQQSLRKHDTLVRWGGEEFVAILPATDATQAALVAEKLRALVEIADFQTRSGSVKTTISIGIAAYRDEYATIDKVIEEADQALYKCKAEGRNRTEVKKKKTL